MSTWLIGFIVVFWAGYEDGKDFWKTLLEVVLCLFFWPIMLGELLRDLTIVITERKTDEHPRV